MSNAETVAGWLTSCKISYSWNRGRFVHVAVTVPNLVFKLPSEFRQVVRIAVGDGVRWKTWRLERMNIVVRLAMLFCARPSCLRSMSIRSRPVPQLPGPREHSGIDRTQPRLPQFR